MSIRFRLLQAVFAGGNTAFVFNDLVTNNIDWTTCLGAAVAVLGYVWAFSGLPKSDATA